MESEKITKFFSFERRTTSIASRRAYNSALKMPAESGNRTHLVLSQPRQEGRLSQLVMGDSLRTKTIRFDSVQPTSRYLINSLIIVKPVNDNVYVSIVLVLFVYRHLT